MPSEAELADRLFEAFESGTPIAPLTEAQPDLGVEGAYAIARELRRAHEQRAGRTVAGAKVGLTSAAIQRQLGVDEPDYGVLWDSHTFEHGAVLSRGGGRMIAPRLEAELAFELSGELRGPGVEEGDVLAATRRVIPIFEVIDSRIADWRITLADTIADNASGYGVVLGDSDGVPTGDLHRVELVVERDGEEVVTGNGSAVMGHPARSVAWLANTLAAYGEALAPGQPILSGSFTAAFDALPGRYRATFDHGVGQVEVTIEE